ncbi:hypothetical protein CR513_52686, partial [Mucuna pruriens]
MLNVGTIPHNTSSFSSSVLLAHKKGGTWCFCVDYQCFYLYSRTLCHYYSNKEMAHLSLGKELEGTYDSSDTNSRATILLVEVVGYDYEIFYKPWVENKPAYALSRIQESSYQFMGLTISHYDLVNKLKEAYQYKPKLKELYEQGDRWECIKPLDSLVKTSSRMACIRRWLNSLKLVLFANKSKFPYISLIDSYQLKFLWVTVDCLSKAAHFSMLPTHHTTAKMADSFAQMELFRLSGTKLQMSTAYHPLSDGQTEVVNRTLQQYLRTYVHDQPRL